MEEVKATSLSAAAFAATPASPALGDSAAYYAALQEAGAAPLLSHCLASQFMLQALMASFACWAETSPLLTGHDTD